VSLKLLYIDVVVVGADHEDRSDAPLSLFVVMPSHLDTLYRFAALMARR